MAKMKTCRGAMKRVKVTATGRVSVKHAYRRHLLEAKSRKRKRQLRGNNIVRDTEMRRMEKLLPGIL